MRKMLIPFLFLAIQLQLMAQTEAPTPRQAMEQIAFMNGKWQGSGWQIGQDRQKHAFQQTEDIYLTGAGEVMVIHGLGKSKDPETGEEREVHNAVAMITYNTREGHYDFSSYVVGRGGGNYTGKVTGENQFEWYLDTPNGQIRYIISLNEKGQWHETGEIAMGENWFQFFEMTLDRVGDSRP
jgi:hypothetical protein